MPVWRAQSAVIRVYNIFILNFRDARVRARDARAILFNLALLLIHINKKQSFKSFCKDLEFTVSELIVKTKEIVIKDFKTSKIVPQTLSCQSENAEMSFDIIMYSNYKPLIEADDFTQFTQKLFASADIDQEDYVSAYDVSEDDYNVCYLPHEIDPVIRNQFRVCFKEILRSGPLCSEPICGLGFIVSNFSTSFDKHDAIFASKLSFLLNTEFKKKFVINDFRIFWPVYECVINCSQSFFKQVNSIIVKRLGQITSHELEDESNFDGMLTLFAYVPVLKSFGLYNVLPYCLKILITEVLQQETIFLSLIF